MTEDGYPSDAELERIRKWDLAANGWDFAYNAHEFMDFIGSKWTFSSWGWRRKKNRYYVSTGGWSGNESLIAAMQENFIFWAMCWVQHRRGGHYIFQVSKMGGKGTKGRYKQPEAAA